MCFVYCLPLYIQLCKLHMDRTLFAVLLSATGKESGIQQVGSSGSGKKSELGYVLKAKACTIY